MFRPRVIPVLLLKGEGLVKSIGFRKFNYIGDPINAVRIFNDLKADELVFLDIDASIKGRSISLDFVRRVGKQANMPFAVGGGIGDLSTIRDIISCGAEKVVVNTAAYENQKFIELASKEFGSSTIVVSIDVKKDIFNRKKVYIKSGTIKTSFDPIYYSKLMENLGAGELLINSIDNDGMMLGYDIELIKSIANSVNIPVVACGGAGSYIDFRNAVILGNASAVAAGSLFVYHGPRKAVLINFPTYEELNKIFCDENNC